MVLKIYGYMLSQPTRAVVWVLKLKGVHFEFYVVNPHNGDANNDTFRAMNPNGFVPVLQDDKFTLFEGAAILTYLGEKFGWTDMVPSEIHLRATMQQYLHWHHTNMRATIRPILVSHISKAKGIATPVQCDCIATQDKNISALTTLFERIIRGPFIIGTKEPTVADLMAYCELSQVETMGIFDFSTFPQSHAWLTRMKELPFHDEMCKDINTLLETLHLKPIKTEL